MTATIYPGDCLASLRRLPDGVARTCVTSPPYYGLRDYGTATWEGGDPACDHRPNVKSRATRPLGKLHAGFATIDASTVQRDCHCGARRIDDQIGLEETPEAYVARLVEVFREVRRVLADDGTLWLNLGDSYAANRSYQVPSTKGGPKHAHAQGFDGSAMSVPDGLKPKDLVGIPWRVAFALQQPYYTGTIRNEVDRVWLAAMLDAEGCLFIHKRKAGQHNGQGYYRQNDNYGPGVEICNTSLAVVERIMALVGKGSVSTSESGRHGRKQTLYRWNLRTVECRDFVREVYPYLIAKRQQARILCGCPSSGEQAEAAHAALIGLHGGGITDVDFLEPAPMFEPGFYLRSDIIWSKNNPMPESVRDRPTKAHEYVFLLSKRERYYYDAAAIAEAAANPDGFKYAGGYKNTLHMVEESKRVNVGSARLANGTVPHFKAGHGEARNARTVWTIATQPYPEAHFATFPEELPSRCIRAGSAPGDTVLDPFGGSGTTGAIAVGLGRKAILCELNPAYIELARQRIGPMLCEVAA